ncbi:MAG: hypothetical protein M1833_005756 [Piccolia ochrophora]|nr:MAG: hypothetical protein M1833_005756 [Piccolia ochrophora]
MVPDRQSIDFSHVEDLQHFLKTQYSEFAYDKSYHKADLIVADEDSRRLRLQVIHMEDENDELHDQLADEDERVTDLEYEAARLREQKEDAMSDLQRAYAELRVKTREVDSTKAEMKTLNDVSANTTKLLTEKLALTRELATLKPELEHLRVQVLTQQSAISEKLAVQRELSTMQVDLENERRAVQRALSKESKGAEQDAQLTSQLEAVRAELAKEKRERERLEREARKGSSDADARVAVLESKLDAFREKLRSTKEQLKDTRSQLQQAENLAAADATSRTASGALPAKTARNPRKRNAAHLGVDMALGTPDGVAGNGRGPAAKRGKRSSALLGDKSTFSITPYLNRTGSIAPESPRDPANGKTVEEPSPLGKESTATEGGNSEAPTVIKRKYTKKTAKLEAPNSQPLGPANPGKTNPRVVSTKKVTTASSLDMVTEENEENEDKEGETDDHHQGGTATSEQAKGASAPVVMKPAPKLMKDFAARDEAAEPAKKKKKLLGGIPGKTLFDEEDGEWAKPTGRTLFGGTKGLSLLAKGSKPSGITRVLATEGSAFGGFSPRKKEKRAAVGK